MKKLGFGFMRLPKENEVIDIETTKKMVDLFLEAGGTYFDTAWAYTGSEDALRQALVERYPRESFQLATKLSAWIKCETREDAVSQFETSLKQTGAGYFDYYLLHNLGQNRTHLYEEFGLWDWVQEKKKEGLIRHVGFSAHTSPEELDEILTKHPEVEFVQLQINYADWDNPVIRSRECYEVARKHRKPVIIMEPVKGGLLAAPPAPVAELFKEAEPDMSPASWAIRFAADLDGVLAVLSGMSSIEQVQDNVAYMKDFEGMTDAERETMQQALRAIADMPVVPCTSCHYCEKVCPANIGIAGSFAAVNLLTLYGDKDKATREEQWHVERQGKVHATECLKCGKCEDACPQHIEIRKELEKVCHALLEG